MAALSLAALLVAAPLAAAAPSLYVANAGSGYISQYGLDLAGFPSPLSPPAVATFEGPEEIALSPDGSSAYVTNQVDDRVSQYDIDPGTGALTPKSPSGLTAWDAPVAIALSPDGRSAYVVVWMQDAVIQYDVDPLDGTLHGKQPTSSVTTGSLPRDVAVSPDGTSAYVVNQGSDDISQYDVDPADGSLSPKAQPTVAAGASPFGIAVSPDGTSLYATDIDSDQVSQYDIDPDDGSLAAKAPAVATGSDPDGIAVSPDGADAYVANSSSASVSHYGIGADGSLSLEGTVALGSSLPTEVVLSPDGATAYVSSYTNRLFVYGVDPGDGSLSPQGTVNTGSAPGGIAVLADTTGPTATIDSGPDGAVAERDAAFAFSASEPGSDFECALDAAPFGPCSSPQGYAGLGDGEHSFRVRATDPWQNTGPVAQRDWTVDTTGPGVTIDSGPSGTVAKRGARFSFSAGEPGSSFECSLGADFSACSSPLSYAGLANGAHVFAVRATDPLGNVGPVARRRWKIAIPSPPAKKSPHPPAPPPVIFPSSPNRVSLGELRRDRRRGTAKLTVRVTGPGRVRLLGTAKVRAASRRAKGPGRLVLPVRPKREAKRQLRERGRVTVRLRVRYRPAEGEPRSARRRARLIQLVR